MKLSNLLTLANLFYKKSLLSLAAMRNGVWTSDDEDEDDYDYSDPNQESDPLQKTKLLLDKINNKDLKSLIEKIIFASEKTIEKLYEISFDPEEEKWEDYVNILKKYWGSLNTMHYLGDDVNYNELISPQEVINTIQELLDSIIEKAILKGKSEGVTEEETAACINQALQDTGLNPNIQGAEDIQDQVTAQKYSYNLSKRKKQLAAKKEKLKFVKKIGLDALIKYREDLQEKIDKETNIIEKEKLKSRLKDTINPQTIINQKISRQKRWERIKADPTLKSEYNVENTRRQATHMSKDEKRLELISAWEDAENQLEKNKIEKQIVDLELLVLSKNGIKFDDSDEGKFNSNDPYWIEYLKPENIISRNKQRLSQYKQRHHGYGQKKKELLASGTFAGLIKKLLLKVNTCKSETKKKIIIEIIQTIIEAKQNEFKPYLDAIDQSKRRNDKEALRKASKELEEAMDKEKASSLAELHPTVVEIAAICDKFRKLAYSFKTLNEAAGSAEQISEKISELNMLIKQTTGKKYTDSMIEASLNIIKYLEQSGQKNE